ncbi:CHASE3 domain-containing protein [Paenibacillus humicus]|uniref:CHASE3 domain-containing protein n=1 Tax=Paenibacillus humicus TaxID=412861 RepID=UPI000FDAE431|nr:CHASE3 domain-containing protein [Paenibacillus humicus]
MSSQSKRRITIRTKIIAGYAVILICLAISIFVVFNQLDKVQQETNYITSHDIEVHNLTNKIEKNVLDMETGQRGFIVTGEDNYLEPYRNGFSQWQTNYDSLMALISDNPLQMKTLESIRSVIEEWLAITMPVIDSKQDGDEEAVRKFYVIDRGKQDMDKLRGMFEGFRSTEKTLTSKRLANLEEGNSMLRTTLLSLFGLSIFLSALIGWLLSRSIVRTIRNVTDCLEGMSGESEQSAADLSIRVPISTSDEVADLAAETNKLLEKLEGESWIQRYSVELGSRLQGAEHLNETADMVVRYIAEALKAPYGALYISNPQHSRAKLTLAASVSGSGSGLEEASASFGFGEGLVGRTAAEKLKRSYTVPETYIRISSGLGSAPPSHLLLVPVLFEGKTLGVLELASFKPFEHHLETFAEKAADMLGSALNRLFTQMQIQSLLRESQAMTEELQVQTEELQTQQEELSASNEQLGRQFVLSEEKNDELSQIQEELKQYSERLEQTSRYKSEFLGNMSHELRTPLNSMLILSEMLAENPAGNLSEKEEEFARVIHSAGEDLLDLINDILDLTKIEAGRMDLHVDAINMSELPESVFSGFSGIAHKHQLDFKMNCGEDVPATLYTDERKLRQILKNLLSNAFKFTPQGGVSLEIALVPAEEAAKLLPQAGGEKIVSFKISDTGIGIDPSKQEVIFDAFQQADGTTSRQFGGTGLGLSISRELAGLLRGLITLDSSPGAGSAFTLYVPSLSSLANAEGGTKQSAEAESPSFQATPERRDRERSSATAEAAKQQAAASSDRIPSHPALAGRLILLVDDDIRNVYSLSNALEIEGAEVLTANNGEEALQLLDEREDIDVVLMDMMMPVMDGYEATRRIREHPLYRDIPVIALTAKAMMQDRDLCLAAGASDYISKPIAIEQLYSLIEVWMPKKKRV